MILKKKGNLLIAEREGMQVPVFDSKYSYGILELPDCSYELLDAGYLALYTKPTQKQAVSAFLKNKTDIKHSVKDNVVTIQIGKREPRENAVIDSDMILNTPYYYNDKRVFSIVFGAMRWTKETAIEFLQRELPKLKTECKAVKGKCFVFEQRASKEFVKNSEWEEPLKSENGDPLEISLILGLPKPKKVKRG